MDESTPIIEAAVRVLVAILDKQPQLSSDLAILRNFLGAGSDSDPGLLVIAAIFKALEQRQKVRIASS